ncbi:hypothetical protein SprV_0100141000 [Sparganum proliferum]
MQRSTNLFSAARENFVLVVNTQKMLVMLQSPPPNTATPPTNALPPPPPRISVNGTQLQVSKNFPYLGSTLSRITKIDDEVARRISKASQAFGRLQSTVWKLSWSPTEREPEDVQGRRTADAAVRSGDLDSLHKAGTPTEPLPPQLSSSHLEAELARSNPRH